MMWGNAISLIFLLNYRDKLLNAWIKTVTDNELDKKYAFLNDILVKSKGLFAPKKKKDGGTKSTGKAKDKKYSLLNAFILLFSKLIDNFVQKIASTASRGRR